jgi:DNA-binding transcriptional regulator YiaG
MIGGPMTAPEVATLARVRALCASGAARSIRVAAQMSLGEFGRGLGVSPSTVLRWERFDRQPRGDAGLRYAALLDQLLQPGKRP